MAASVEILICDRSQREIAARLQISAGRHLHIVKPALAVSCWRATSPHCAVCGTALFVGNAEYTRIHLLHASSFV
ncbi:hypothetical protein [Variovorax sp. V213]|uniref:hypothetical protein n=1 Tax=Variovorax sp. V213 TaxID=3065955 RepID=UPI0034E8DDFB